MLVDTQWQRNFGVRFRISEILTPCTSSAVLATRSYVADFDARPAHTYWSNFPVWLASVARPTFPQRPTV